MLGAGDIHEMNSPLKEFSLLDDDKGINICSLFRALPYICIVLLIKVAFNYMVSFDLTI